MVGVVKEIDGQKVIVPMSGGNGNPLGTIIAVYSNVCPSGYLPCGVDFDENQYPALFALLGTNHTPEEGFEMDWANAESVTLSTSDYVVTKNGWLVGRFLPVSPNRCKISVNGVVISAGVYDAGRYTSDGSLQIAVKKGDVVKSTVNIHEQEVSLVPYKYRCCIKARSGLDEMQQDYVLNALNEAGSYSTEEVATGKKWIDGKTIYRKVINFTGSIIANAWSWGGIQSTITALNIDVMVSATGVDTTNGYFRVFNFNKANGFSTANGIGSATSYFILEYTKTT